jgi:hypothetical protein
VPGNQETVRLQISAKAEVRDYLSGSKPKMRSFEASWSISCSSFKHCARHSAIRSPKFDPTGAVGATELILTVGLGTAALAASPAAAMH